MPVSLTSADPENFHPRPQSLGELFIAFTLLALQGFGGVLAIAQRELVERRRWLTQEEFIEDLAVAQIMPGPNIVNLCMMIGARYFGLRGALTALAGMLTMPLFVVLGLAVIYARFSQHPGVAGALRGMSAVAAGLIIASGLRLLPSLKHQPLGILPCCLLGGLCLIAIAVFRWPLMYVLPVLGIASCALTYLKLKP